MAEWKPGDEPRMHPLWKDEVSLEMEMVEAGRSAFLARLGSAREKQHMTTMTPYRQAMEVMATDMGHGLKGWLNSAAKARRKGGMVPFAFLRLKSFDPFVAAFITVRTVLDNLCASNPSAYEKGGRHSPGVITLANAIGLAVEHEARMAAWFAKEPKLFQHVQKKLKDQKATEEHRARVNINRFNVLMKERLDWHDWPQNERQHVGLKLIDILIRTTGQFSIEEEHHGHRRAKVHKGRHVLIPSEELMATLIKGLGDLEDRSPTYVPTLIPPKRWQGNRGGGYYTPMVPTPTLVRFKADNEEVRGAALEEYDALDMPRVVGAVNHVQEVPWTVNERVLAVVLEAWERDLGLAGLVRQEPEALPQKPAGMERLDLGSSSQRKVQERAWVENHPEEVQGWKRAASQVYGRNALLPGLEDHVPKLGEEEGPVVRARIEALSGTRACVGVVAHCVSLSAVGGEGDTASCAASAASSGTSGLDAPRALMIVANLLGRVNVLVRLRPNVARKIVAQP